MQAGIQQKKIRAASPLRETNKKEFRKILRVYKKTIEEKQKSLKEKFLLTAGKVLPSQTLQDFNNKLREIGRIFIKISVNGGIECKICGDILTAKEFRKDPLRENCSFCEKNEETSYN